METESSESIASRLFELEHRFAALEREVGDLKRHVADEPALNGIDIARTFHDLALEWRSAESPASSVKELAMHPAYQKIIGLGPAAVPLIIAELNREPDHWFWALEAITGADPVPVDVAGDLDAMAAAWIDWARAHGLA
ncbi:MAG: hypothetical protein K2Y37_20665 [Pirellulales bacterium]|nr:hypothetical protein [Pirellulales bacterium]